MDSRANRRLLLVWLGLSTITILQWGLSSSTTQEVLIPNAAVTFGVIAMALVKVRFIVREFMEVRHAPALLCRLTDAWIALTALALLGTYFVGMGLR